jgi:signal transduction histidine kinase
VLNDTDLNQLLIESPGDTLYFVLIAGFAMIGLFISLGQRQRDASDLLARRLVLAMAGILLAWLALLGGAVLAFYAEIESQALLPPLERAAILMTILLSGWAFAAGMYKDRAEIHRIALVGAMGVVLSFGVTFFIWSGSAPDAQFLQSSLSMLWAVTSTLLAGIMVAVSLSQLNDLTDAPLIVVMHIVFAVGNVFLVVQGQEANAQYSGVLRWSMLGGVAVLMILVYRSVVGSLLTSRKRAIETSQKAIQTMSKQKDDQPNGGAEQRAGMSPIERESVQLMRALGLMLENATPQSLPNQVVQSLITVLKVDVAAILRVKDANYADVEAAYDRFLEREASGMAINLEYQPTLVNSIERHSQRSLYPERNESELEDFYTRLDIEQIGPTYFQPMYREEELIAIVMVGLPYSKREMARADVELLKGLGVIASSLLEMSYTAIDAQMLAEERAIQAMVNRVSPSQLDDADVIAARQELQASLQLAREQIAQLSNQVVALKRQLDQERNQFVDDLGDSEEALSASQQMMNLHDEHQQLREERDALAAELQEATAALHSASDQDDLTLYKEMIESLKLERQDLVSQRDLLQQEIEQIQNASGTLPDPRDVQAMLDRMDLDRERLEAERDQLADKLHSVREQLRSIGIETESAGLTGLLTRLVEQRSALIIENEQLQAELAQWKNTPTGDQVERIAMLQATLKNVASDREVALKQRDTLRRELDDMRHKVSVLRQRWKELEDDTRRSQARARVLEEEKSIMQAELLRVSNERSTLINARDRLDAERQALETQYEQLLARMEGDRGRVEALGENGVGSLTGMIQDLTAQREALDTELNTVRANLQAAENEIERLKLKNLQPKAQHPRPEDPDLLIGLVQEFRMPMTSITGYIDLLLSESAGILGEMQRKFLQRVYTGVQRLDTMLDDLIKVTELDTGKYGLMPMPVDAVVLVEEAIKQGANQLREKGLVVNLILQDDLPSIQADHDALSQIIGQLLTNAYLASPPDSEITVRAEYREAVQLNDDTVSCLYISIADQGGGIEPSELDRVFARKYRADNPLIQGLGDTGVGLSIAKALVEAQGGQLWLETEEHVGSTFQFLLPVDGVIQYAS